MNTAISNQQSANVNKKKYRDSNIELLRIIAMFMIVMSHASFHGVLRWWDLPFGWDQWILEIFTLGNLSVDIFVIISGFFMVNSKFKPGQFVRLLFQVFFISVVIYLFALGFGLIPFSIIGIIKNFLPTLFQQYWFFTAYIVLYLIFPYLNIMINGMSQKKMLSFILLMIILWSFISTFTSRNLYGTEIPQFIMFYFIGAFIGKYYKNNSKKQKRVGLVFMLSGLFLMMLSSLCFDLLAIKYPFFLKGGVYFYGRTSVLTIMSAIGFLLWFKNIRIGHSKLINWIASCTFGIYLIHDNNIIRSLIWKTLFRNDVYAFSNKLVLYLLLTSLIVFVVCLLLESLRKIFIEKPMIPVFDKLGQFVGRKLDYFNSED